VIDAADRSRSLVRDRRRRRLGWGLVSFGVAGLVLVAAAAALVVGSLAAVDDAATGFEHQRAELVSMLEPAASAMSDAADSAAHAGSSLTAASDASRRAADLTNRLAASFDAMAGLGSFEILGSRPFAGITSQFNDTATQSRALSTDLGTTADALATNVADSQAVSADLRSLADRLTQLQASIGGAGGAGSTSSLPIALARLVLLGLLAWFSIPAIVSTWLGSRLIRARSRTLSRG
jgi:ABC-type transporter Mla subunit MlaD